MASVIAEVLIGLDCLNFNVFFCPQPKVTYKLNFMKLILNIYDYDEVMHEKFYRAVVNYSGVFAL